MFEVLHIYMSIKIVCDDIVLLVPASQKCTDSQRTHLASEHSIQALYESMSSI